MTEERQPDEVLRDEFSEKRCSRCGALRLKSGVCSLVSGSDGKGGCPDPTYDYYAEKYPQNLSASACPVCGKTGYHAPICSAAPSGSIFTELAQARQQIEQMTKDSGTFTEQLRDALGAPADRTWFNTGLLEVARSKVQQLADARAQGMREAAEIARSYKESSGWAIARDIERAAEAQKAQFFAEGAHSQALIDRRNKPAEPKP